MKLNINYALLVVFGLLFLVGCVSDHEEAAPVQKHQTPTSKIQGMEYENKANMVHYALVFLNGSDERVAKEKVKKFNKQNDYKLGVNIIAVDERIKNGEWRKCLAIRRLENLNAAEKYTAKLKKSNIFDEKETIVSASQDNYRRLLSKKDIQEYIEFYSENILAPK